MAVTSAGIRMADMLTTPVTSILIPNISYTPSAEVLETELCIANGFEAFNFLEIDRSNEIDFPTNKPGLSDQEKEEITRALWKIESSFTGSSSNEDRIVFMAAINSAVEITKYYLHKMTDSDKEEINYKILGMKHICSHRLKLRVAQTEAQIISIRNEIQSQSARFSNTCSRSLKICQMVSNFFNNLMVVINKMKKGIVHKLRFMLLFFYIKFMLMPKRIGAKRAPLDFSNKFF